MPKLSQKKGIVKWNTKETGIPMFDESIKDQESIHRKFNPKLEWVDTDKFLKLQKDILWDYASKGLKDQAYNLKDHGESPKDFNWRLGIEESSQERIKKGIKTGSKFNAFAVVYDKKGEVEDFQEGRNRIIAFKQVGQKKVPVWKMKRR